MFFESLRISTKLNVAFAALIGAFLISSGVVYSSLRSIDEATTSAERSLTAAAQSEAMMTHVIEQQNALRGYVMDGDPALADSYRKAQGAFDTTVAQFAGEARAPEQKAQAAEMQGAMNAWRGAIGDKALSMLAAPGGRDQAVKLLGQKSLGDLRRVYAEIRAQSEARIEKGQQARRAAISMAVTSLAIGAVAAVAIAGLMGWLLARTIARPVAGITGVMRRLAAGDNTVEVPAVGRRDEVGHMAAAVLSFKDAALEKLRVETEAAEHRRRTEAEREEREREKAREAEQDTVAIGALAEGLNRLAAGDLTARITVEFAPKADGLKRDFNAAAEKLEASMGSIVISSHGVDSSASEIARASDDLSRRNEQQAASLEETAAALDEITATVQRTAEVALDASATVVEARRDAERSGEVVDQAVAAMAGIESSSRQVSEIIGVIDEIAFQTNLLALNAGVEAARAGEAGKGFAVVASEVRALAQRSAEAAKEIKRLIASSTEQVAAGVGLVGQTGVALKRIVDQVAAIDGRVKEIASSAREQSSGLQQVNEAVNQMDQVVQQNAAMAEQASAATRTLQGEAGSLASLIAQFRLAEARRRSISSGPLHKAA